MMMTRSENKFPVVDVGVNIVIRIPDVDKGKTEYDLYRIGCKDVILEKLYCGCVHYYLFIYQIK